MQSPLAPAHYTDPAVHALEQQRLFRCLWIFAGLKSSLAGEDAYLTREIGGEPVVVLRRHGELRAFENRCPHRGMPVFPDAFGQARAVCPYHGWVFEDDGRVKTIPHADTLYRYTEAERGALCLRRYAVACIGELVFVNLAPEPPLLTAQFTPAFQQALRDVTSHLGKLAVHADIDARYNWKLNHENVLDANHVAYVHPESFAPLLTKAGAAPAPSSAAREPEDVTRAVRRPVDLPSLSFHADAPYKITPEPWHAQVDRGAAAGHGTYRNFYIFPNVNFIAIGGLTFLVQQFHPLAADRTQVRMTLTTAREHRRLPGMAALLRAHLKGEVAVLHEDRVLLESLQGHLHAGARPAQHGHYEHRLVAFSQGYLQCLEQPP